MSLKYSDLGLEPRLYAAIEKLGYQDCTPVQEAVIPHVLAGKDVSGLAQTGTGKTAAFLVPLMDRLLKGQITDWKATNFILILVPTRELCEQVYENVVKLSEVSGLRGVAVYGGTGYDKQKEAFRNQVEFVVATPGRLIDLYKEHFVDLKQVRAIVFDEADRMFDMGFKDDMKFILQRVPKERQFLVFSATMNFDVLNTAYQFGAEPIEINVSRDQTKAENVKDEIFHVGQDDKPAYLLSLLKKHTPKQTIIFSNFKNNVERIAQYLSSNGFPAMGISSLLTQAQRNRVLELFKADNEQNILVATDVAARGLDIKGVDLVINFELPMDAESYVHRIGRTGRAGTEGKAFSLVSDRDVDSLARVEEYLKHKLPTGWMEDSELIKDAKPFPREDRGRRFEGGPRRDGREGGRDGGGRGGRPGGGDRGRGGDRGLRPQGDRPRHNNNNPDRQQMNGPQAGNGAAAAANGAHPVSERSGERPARRPFNRDRKPQNNEAGGEHQNGEARQAGGHPSRDRRPQHGRGGENRNDRGNGKAKQVQSSNGDLRALAAKVAAGGPRRPGQGGKPNQGRHAKAGAPKTSMQKVSGFFKKLFGGA